MKEDFDIKLSDDDTDDLEDENAISFEKKDEEEIVSNSFGNSFSSSNKNNLANKKFTNIIVIGSAVLFGIVVFIIVYIVFNPRQPKEEFNKDLDINSELVQNLYSRVTYGINNVRYDKFIKEPIVTIDNLTNYDKFYYALSLAQNTDFLDTGTATEQSQIQYTLNASKLDSFMRDFFGDNITYDKKTTINYTFANVNKQGFNKGTLMYDDNTKKYNIVFTTKDIPTTQSIGSKKFFSELKDAIRLNEDEIELTEYIVYTKCSPNPSKTYTCMLYKDYENSIKIRDRDAVSNDTVLNFEDYPNHTTIKYVFKKNSENNYSFKSSKIIYSN